MKTPPRIRDHREPGHYWADNEVVDNYLPIIGAYGFAVYMLLTRFANHKTGQCDPSLKTIATTLGISPPTAKKALDALEEAGLITITYRPRASANRKVNETNIYTLLAVEKEQKGTQGDWVPKEIGYQVPNDVDKGTQGDWVGVPKEVGTNNKGKEKKESGGETPARAYSDLALAIAEVCMIDPQIATDKQKRDLNATYKALHSIGATAADVRAREVWWYSNDWRAKKEGRAPRPDELRAIWKEAAAPIKKQSNGARPPADLPLITAAADTKQVATPEERRRIIEARRTS